MIPTKVTIKTLGDAKLCQKEENGYTLVLQGEDFTIETASVEFSFAFQKGDKLFLNGYQSWTQSHEEDLHTYDKSLKYCPKFAVKKLGLTSYGDGHFYPLKYQKGVRHGYSYAYVRRGETYYLFGSLAENTGFTRIIFDDNQNTVTFEKDCIGRVVKGEYKVFDLYFAKGTENEVFDGWFQAMGITARTKEKATGYTSWYNYYQNISEDILRHDLKDMKTLPNKADIFQIDDGFETAVGDWLSLKAEFPNGLESIVQDIKKKGYRPGLWLAPFVCEKTSKLFAEHQDWLVKRDGEPIYGGCNWSGMYSLDFYNEEVRAYIREVFAHYKKIGFTLFKLDFLYAVCMIPRPDKTRGEIMWEAMDFLREVCGDAYILGCGVPLASAFGKVEYCRIGMDMTLDWNDVLYMRIIHSERPSTKNTMLNSIYRRQLSGRAFLNDPDVFLLRENNMKLSWDRRVALATVNGLFGGLLFASDSFGSYQEEQKEVYRKILSLMKAKVISVEKGREMTITYEMDGKIEKLVYSV